MTEQELKELNTLRLTFWPASDDLAVAPDLTSAQSRAGLTALLTRHPHGLLISEMSLEEKRQRIQILLDLTVQLTQLVYSESNRDKIKKDAEAEKELKAKIAKEVNTRDSDKIKEASLIRKEQKLRKELGASAIWDKDYCRYCETKYTSKPWTQFCLPLPGQKKSNCEKAFKFTQQMMKNYAMSESEARDQANIILRANIEIPKEKEL